jgi:hypothetical protein
MFLYVLWMSPVTDVKMIQGTDLNMYCDVYIQQFCRNAIVSNITVVLFRLPTLQSYTQHVPLLSHFQFDDTFRHYSVIIRSIPLLNLQKNKSHRNRSSLLMVFRPEEFVFLSLLIHPVTYCALALKLQ